MIEMILNFVEWLMRGNTSFWSLDSNFIKITPIVKTFESVQAYDSNAYLKSVMKTKNVPKKKR